MCTLDQQLAPRKCVLARRDADTAAVDPEKEPIAFAASRVAEHRYTR